MTTPAPIPASRDRTRALAEGGVAVALASVLSLVTVFRMPLGGSVTAASVLPLWLYARRRGVRAGALAGAVHGALQVVFGGTVIHPVQGALDYLMAYGAQGMAGWRGAGGAAVGVAAAILLRLAAHGLAGWFFFADAPAGWSVTGYLAAYNAGFLVPDAAVALLAWGALRRARPDLAG